jgi:tripeptide aminopeptidase
VTIEGRLDYESFLLKRDEPSVAAAATALAAESLAPEYAIANGGLDANWLTHNGIPTVTLGCGQHAIHTVDEYVEVEEFAAACRVALRLATV